MKKHTGTIKASVPSKNPLKPKGRSALPSGVAAIKRAAGYETRKQHRLAR